MHFGYLNEVLWGLGTAANTAVLGHMGSAAVAANSVAQVARQLATVVAFGLASATVNLSWKDNRGEKIRTCKSLCAQVRMAQCTDGSARWNLNPCDCSVYGGGDDIVRDCQRVHAVLCFLLCLIL